ncbi:hypothetical protein C8F04DRAFT_1259546 [Mycena alexandri]|uniref:Uncharacterized protein n=1 Tax=Mycena alexandri TaxID=1745969 RepID=A0AAD6T006_9AGAR|nr:hypothetical protein C8F04DRAFT_1259546 [Mycena alexandri]
MPPVWPVLEIYAHEFEQCRAQLTYYQLRLEPATGVELRARIIRRRDDFIRRMQRRIDYRVALYYGEEPAIYTFRSSNGIPVLPPQKMPDASTQTDDASIEREFSLKREAIDWVEGKLTGPPSAEMLRWLGVNLVAEPAKKAAEWVIPTLRSAADKTTADYINPLSQEERDNLERVRKAAVEELDRLSQATAHRRGRELLNPPKGWRGKTKPFQP